MECWLVYDLILFMYGLTILYGTRNINGESAHFHLFLIICTYYVLAKDYKSLLV